MLSAALSILLEGKALPGNKPVRSKTYTPDGKHARAIATGNIDTWYDGTPAPDVRNVPIVAQQNQRNYGGGLYAWRLGQPPSEAYWDYASKNWRKNRWAKTRFMPYPADGVEQFSSNPEGAAGGHERFFSKRNG